MSIVTNFGFTNNSESKSPVTPIDIGVTTNYALIEDEPTSCVLTNKTAPIDIGELLSYKCTNIKNVSTAQDVLHPAKVTAGVQYVVKLEEIASVTSDTDPSFRTDLPIVAYLTIRHPKAGEITEDMVAQTVRRLIGACRKSDGSWRFGDLMRSSLKPEK